MAERLGSDPVNSHGREGIVIVGGSLCGLTLALACAKFGIRSRVFERSHGETRTGGALGIDRALLARVTGVDRAVSEVAPLPIIESSRSAASWDAVQSWLRRQAMQRPEISLIQGVGIDDVRQSATAATACTSEGKRVHAPVIIGADGYSSIVRSAMNRTKQYPPYAGYLVWRGLVDERHLPEDARWPRNDDGTALISEEGYRLVAYPIPGINGSLRPGERRISFTWYDPKRTALLREQHCLTPSLEVASSLSRQNVPSHIRDELHGLAKRIWPEPWRTAVIHALDHREIFATPIAEYFPQRLYNNRLAIVGDAAHIASPAIGRGFSAGILDADALAESIHQAAKESADWSQALRYYEGSRLGSAQELVTSSAKWSRSFLRSCDERSARAVLRSA